MGRWGFVLAGVLFIGAITTIAFDITHKPLKGSPDELLIPSGFQGQLAIPEDKFLPIIEQAQREVRIRYDKAYTLRWWSDLAGWAGLFLASLITIVSGFLGKPVKPDPSTPATLDHVIAEQNQSKGLLRAIGVLIAVATIPPVISQRLQSHADRYNLSAAELNKVIVAATDTLYDERTTRGKAQQQVNQLMEAIARR